MVKVGTFCRTPPTLHNSTKCCWAFYSVERTEFHEVLQKTWGLSCEGTLFEISKCWAAGFRFYWHRMWLCFFGFLLILSPFNLHFLWVPVKYHLMSFCCTLCTNMQFHYMVKENLGQKSWFYGCERETQHIFQWVLCQSLYWLNRNFCSFISAASGILQSILFAGLE